AGEVAAIAVHPHPVEPRVARGLDLVAGVGEGAQAADLDLPAGRQVEQVEAVRGVVVDAAAFEDPAAASSGGAEAVAIAARLLRPAAKGLATGPAFGAAVPGDLHGDEAQRAGIGAAALPEVAVPAGPAIAGDAHPLERPVPRATDMEAAHGQAVHVEVADPHVAGVARVHARAGPVAEGRRLARAGGDLALAAAGMAVVLDAGGVVGDLEAGELHMVDPAQVDDAGGALAAPQLRRIVAGAAVAAAEDAGRPRRGSGWQRRHVSVPGEVPRPAA